jgi:hypothetical protein
LKKVLDSLKQSGKRLIFVRWERAGWWWCEHEMDLLPNNQPSCL